MSIARVGLSLLLSAFAPLALVLAGACNERGGSDDGGSAIDAGVVDAGVVDAGVFDAGVVDAGAQDAGVADAGSVDAGSAGDGGTLSGVCQTEHAGATADGEAVARCDAFFADAPFVHLAADTSTTFYGSIDTNTFRFMTRDGVAHPLVSADGTTEYQCTYMLQSGECTSVAGLEAARGPSHRWLYTIYRLEGSIDGERIRVGSIAPAVLVEASAIDALLSRTFEGTISTRLVPRTAGDPASSPIFSATTTAIRLEPTGQATPLDLPTGFETLPDADALRIELAIANMSTGVLLADGSCAPSLASLGDANPFVSGTTSTVTIERSPSMHSSGGHHLVIGAFPVGTPDIGDQGDGTPNTMGQGLGEDHPLVSPWTWLAPTEALSTALTDTYNLHGNAFVYNLQLHLGPVTGGGGPCP